MSLRTYLLLLLYASAAAAIGAAWLIASNDPTARHGEVMEQIQRRNVELQRRIDEL
jgi:hypothetical protein